MHTEYQTAAARTMPNTSINHLPIWALGLCGELAECRTADAGEATHLEAGDSLWYCHAILTCLRMDANDVLSILPVAYSDDEPLVYAGHIAEAVKKHFGHFKPLDVGGIVRNVRQIVAIIQVQQQTRYPDGPDLLHLYQQNLLKLQERYPDGFPSEMP